MFRSRILFVLLLLGLATPGLLALPEDIKKNEPSSGARANRKRIQRHNGFRKPDPAVQDLKGFGVKVAERIDSLIQKKSFDLWGDPWTMQGIPLILPSPASGFNLGLRLQLQNLFRQDPHQLEVVGQVLASDLGRYKHQLIVDAPHAFEDKFRITFRLAYDRDVSIQYFGIGNDTSVDPVLVDRNDVRYQNIRSSPNLSLQIFRLLGKYWRIGPIIGLRWMSITAPPGSLLAEERPRGLEGGRTHFVGLGIQYDTLDFEPYPTRGFLNELFVNVAAPWTGSNFAFSRWTYTYRQFIPLHRKLIFAHRTLVEALIGDVPFYELSNVGGSFPSLSLGGDRFFRGYEGSRYLDRIRLALGFELRWDPLFFNFMKQDITLGLVPFFDFGRVWRQLLPAEVGSWHASAGWGARIIWNSRLVVRVDLAFQNEGINVVANLNNAF